MNGKTGVLQKMKTRLLVLAAVLVVFTGACASQNQQKSTALGAAVGAGSGLADRDHRVTSHLDRAPGGPDLRPRARPRRRTRQPRRVDGARRTLPDDVRSAGRALRIG